MRIFPFIILIYFISCNKPKDSNTHVTIVINEFLTSNTKSNFLDENGEPDDWIEIYNNGDDEVDLSGFCLSDDSTDLSKFKFPDEKIGPRNFLVIWADDDPKQGDFHAPFKLSSQDGDEIILSNGTEIIDRIQFFPQSGNPEARIPDVSYGRQSDGDTNWGRQSIPTPGASNKCWITGN